MPAQFPIIPRQMHVTIPSSHLHLQDTHLSLHLCLYTDIPASSSSYLTTALARSAVHRR
ncbi:hypothetical protein SERLA73DRAFT_179446 [Serpula lacrymans var. lacrymans S7.3]|uniref:Uncharacterized protein n=2 Tax=Serpula lacrymans var. lacrymans TaxID=341189 RepID=F8PSG4_SERL3|nr:uncharacterized protein SERLADRAFT_464574 [Serpula lacrymans var. lacrymans S7.9]EGO01294.1 hypothetical protein SERLA73DRAFT_179446 [Serpula lacrymans var. lacrymans S7.3]EGO26933.1 hypothetical protein SERLADRAFT_464574 [Serpula lacrymans var. lacrymans S7.9]